MPTRPAWHPASGFIVCSEYRHLRTAWIALHIGQRLSMLVVPAVAAQLCLVHFVQRQNLLQCHAVLPIKPKLDAPFPAELFLRLRMIIFHIHILHSILVLEPNEGYGYFAA